MITEAVRLVKDFQNSADQPISDKPTLMSVEQVNRRIRWITEELEELKEAVSVEQQADALTDVLYYLLGAFVELGVDPDPLFEIVHNANMEKLQNRKTDSEGKVLKPKGWTHPDGAIKEAIDEMRRKAGK